MAREKISNYRLSQSTKSELKRLGLGNESEGIRFAIKVVKKIGLKEARKLVEGK